MRFLADEGFAFAGVRALRAAGHDVIAVVEIARGSPDSEVLRMGSVEDRVLLTEDKGFGELYRSASRTAGVLLARFPASARTAQGSRRRGSGSQIGERLRGVPSWWCSPAVCGFRTDVPHPGAHGCRTIADACRARVISRPRASSPGRRPGQGWCDASSTA